MEIGLLCRKIFSSSVKYHKKGLEIPIPNFDQHREIKLQKHKSIKRKSLHCLLAQQSPKTYLGCINRILILYFFLAG
jgi:hypothetical protein